MEPYSQIDLLLHTLLWIKAFLISCVIYKNSEKNMESRDSKIQVQSVTFLFKAQKDTS